MLNLIKLEIKRIRLKGYITAGLLITFAVLGLVYLFAAIPHLDASDTDVQIFITYNGIATLSLVVATACFSILSSAMYNRFIVEEYASKKVFLLFSYPVKRSRVLLAKVITVFLFTFVYICFHAVWRSDYFCNILYHRSVCSYLSRSYNNVNAIRGCNIAYCLLYNSCCIGGNIFVVWILEKIRFCNNYSGRDCFMYFR